MFARLWRTPAASLLLSRFSAPTDFRAGGFSVLCHLACDSDARRQAIVDAGAIPTIVAALRIRHPPGSLVPGMAAQGRSALSYLAEDSVVRMQAVVDAGGEQYLLDVVTGGR